MRKPPARRRVWLAIAGCAAALSLLPASWDAERHLETAARIEGSEAQRVAAELAEQFRSPFVDRVILVIRGLPAADSKEGTGALTKIVEELRKEPGVSGVISHLEWADPIFLGRGGGTFVIIGLSPTIGSVEAQVPRLRTRTGRLQRQFQRRFPAAKLELTGETPLNFDIRKASSDDARTAEVRVLPAMLVLLFAAFGSLVAALLPLIIGVLAISMTLGSAALFARHWHLSILIQNLATMLGLGLGIDYALLMVSRFREALAEGLSASDAADVAARHAGHTLLVSASTVAIGFAALLTVPISDIRSIGVAGFLVAGASFLLAVTIVPAVLAFLGAGIDAGRLKFGRKLRQDSSSASVQRWRSWGLRVTSHPWTALAAAGIPLLIVASFAARLSPGLPRDDWLPPDAESVRALHSLEAMQRAGIVQSFRIVLELPPDVTFQTETGWRAVDHLSRRLARDRRADRVISLSTLIGEGRGPQFLSFLPKATRSSLLRGDGRATLLELLPAPSVSPSEQVAWVRELRRADPAKLCGVPGASIRIGGIPALNADYEGIVAERLPSVMALVVGGTLLALLAGFRSVFAALKAIVLNLLSVGAAIGLLVLVFQDGYGSGFFGVPRGTGGVFPIVPILTFAIVFGLSMDYEVFLVARVLEARRSGLSERESIAEGLARTAGLITSAAAIMVVVFAAFTLGGFLVIKMLGFTLAVAVLIDATLVRIVIGPALLSLAGDWNWWPGGLRGVKTARIR